MRKGDESRTCPKHLAWVIGKMEFAIDMRWGRLDRIYQRRSGGSGVVSLSVTPGLAARTQDLDIKKSRWLLWTMKHYASHRCFYSCFHSKLCCPLTGAWDQPAEGTREVKQTQEVLLPSVSFTLGPLSSSLLRWSIRVSPAVRFYESNWKPWKTLQRHSHFLWKFVAHSNDTGHLGWVRQYDLVLGCKSSPHLGLAANKFLC